MERTYLQWNAVNWITVVLMVSIGFTILGLASSAIQSRKVAE